MLHSINVGKTIAKYRKINHMSQTELGCIFNISSQAISKWENGTSMPNIISFSVLADIFNITMHELVGNTNQKPEHDLNYNNRRTASVLNNKSTQNYNVPNRIAFGSLVENAKVLRSNFSGANAQCLIARKSWFIKCNMCNMNASNSNFDHCLFSGSNFTGANLSDCIFNNNKSRDGITSCIVDNALFINSSFRNEVCVSSHINSAFFIECGFSDITLTNVYFKNANFTKCECVNIVFRNCHLIETRFDKCNFHNIKIVKCIIDVKTMNSLKNNRSFLKGIIFPMSKTN